MLSLDHERLWTAHCALKHVLNEFIREDARRRFAQQMKEAAAVVGAGTLLDPDALTIGFARRFATYKRADLIFRDIDRLRRLLHQSRGARCRSFSPARPIRPMTPGKEVLQSVYQLHPRSQFEGRIAFVEDYDMHIAHLLVQGVDLWLNLPRVPARGLRHQRNEGRRSTAFRS